MNFIPNNSPVRPRKLSRVIIPNTAIPAAECGMIMGISMIPFTILLSGKFFLARRYARGIARKENKIVQPLMSTNSAKHCFSPLRFQLPRSVN